jgi:hypothetical protein
VLRVGESQRIESAQVCCGVDFPAIIPRSRVAGNEYKADENVIPSLGVHDCRSLSGVKTSAQLRKRLVRDGGDRIDFFMVLSRAEREIVLGEDDRHLDFRASLLIRRSAEHAHSELIATVVHCHNASAAFTSPQYFWATNWWLNPR